MLKDCHRRIESFLHVLCVVVDRAQVRKVSDEERAAVQAALQYPAGSATLRTKSNPSFHACANPMRKPSKRSTG